MKTKLFISLSVVALFGLSATAYGTLYINGRDKDGNFPKSDCWEMKCPNGCVEEEGTLTGHCCPGDNVCRVDGKDIAECCGEGQTCNAEGKCEQSCVSLYTNKQYKAEAKGSPCCDNLITGTQNVLFSGYNREDGKKYGCCPADRTYNQTCCKTDQKALATGCCNTDKVYTEGEEEKCCPAAVKLLPKKDQSCNATCGCYSEATTQLTCDATTQKCVCPKDYGWDETNEKCLPYCATREKFGVIFIIDRSGSTEGEYEELINSTLDSLVLYENIYSAVYEQDGSKNWERVSWGENNISKIQRPFKNYNLTHFNAIASAYCSQGNNILLPQCQEYTAQLGTAFTKAFKKIKNICQNNSDTKIVYFLMTDGEINKDMKKLQDLQDDISRNCKNATFVLVAKETKATKKYLSEDKFCDIREDVSDCISYFNESVDEEICIQK